MFICIMLPPPFRGIAGCVVVEGAARFLTCLGHLEARSLAAGGVRNQVQQLVGLSIVDLGAYKDVGRVDGSPVVEPIPVVGRGHDTAVEIETHIDALRAAE